MKYLIVNGDDFGYSSGVNQGIIKTHINGIVTSTSVLVDSIAAKEAKNLNRYPNLSVGLHFNIIDKGIKAFLIKHISLPLYIKESYLQREFNRQIKKFKEITGLKPTHIDGHHHIHMHPKVKPIVENYSKNNNIPIRAFGKINFIEQFFGWNRLGGKDLKRVNSEALLKILANLKDGISELMCHPGFADDLKGISAYANEREEEIKTLTDKKVVDFIRNNQIKLINWKEFIKLS